LTINCHSYNVDSSIEYMNKITFVEVPDYIFAIYFPVVQASGPVPNPG